MILKYSDDVVNPSYGKYGNPSVSGDGTGHGIGNYGYLLGDTSGFGSSPFLPRLVEILGLDLLLLMVHADA